jgi:hypothetical protein
MLSSDVILKKGYKPIMPCINLDLKKYENMNVALFLGDLAYDFEGDLYEKMLKHI